MLHFLKKSFLICLTKIFFSESRKHLGSELFFATTELQVGALLIYLHITCSLYKQTQSLHWNPACVKDNLLSYCQVKSSRMRRGKDTEREWETERDRERYSSSFLKVLLSLGEGKWKRNGSGGERQTNMQTEFIKHVYTEGFHINEYKNLWNKKSDQKNGCAMWDWAEIGATVLKGLNPVSRNMQVP